MLKYILVVGIMSIVCQEISGQLQWGNIFGTKRNATIPTVVPAVPFNPTHTCELLKLSMKGVGRDAETILKILATHTYNQREEIAATYKTLYNQDLVVQLFTEFTDDHILDVIKYLFWPTEKMYAREFRDAMVGLGTDERALIEMAASLEGHELRRVNGAYIGLFDKTLESDIKGDTSGFFRDLLVELIKGREADNSVQSVQPRYTVEALNRLGRGEWSNNKDKIRDIFCKKSFSELSEIVAEYERQNGHKIDEDIESEFSGDVKKTLLAIVKCARNRPQFLAEQLIKSMSNFGIKHNVLHRIIVGRSEIDLGNIKEEFAKINGNGINIWLKSTIEGNYWSLIVQLAGYAPEYFKD